MKDHDCSETEPVPLPTRVLDVADNTIKLVETEGLFGHFIALSYCVSTKPSTIQLAENNAETFNGSGGHLSTT